LDSDKIITYPEFDILHKHLERETYEKDKVKILFFDQADMLLSDGSSIYLGFEQNLFILKF